MRMSVSAVSVIAAVVCCAAYASQKTDWASLADDVAVPSGEMWYVDESDMAAVNALSSITVSDSATLVFRDTVTVPKAGLLKGSGTVRKSGASVWSAYANAQTDFTGDWHLDGGVVTNVAAGAFGAYYYSEVTGALHVHDGAALVLNGSGVDFRYRDVRIAGGGNITVPRSLTVLATMDGAVRRLVLEADASIEVGSNYWWLSRQGPLHEGMIDLGTHTLTKYGRSLPYWYFLGVSVAGDGGIAVKEGNVLLRERTSWGGGPESGEFTFESPSGPVNFMLYNKPSVQGRRMRFVSPVVFTYASNEEEAGYSGLWSTNNSHFTGDVALDGEGVELSFLGNNGLYRERYTANAMISFSGTVSGSGKVRVGAPCGTGAGGAMNLLGHNTYAGGTEVLGGGLAGLYAYWPDSVPDLASTVVSNSFLAVRLGVADDGETSRWTDGDIHHAMNTVQFKDCGHISIDATECADGVHEVSVADIEGDVTDISRRTIGCAGGTLRLKVDADDERRIGLAVDRGTLELVGGGTFRLAPTNSLKGIVKPDDIDGTPVSKVLVTDGSMVVQAHETVHVGGAFGEPDYWNGCHLGFARLVVSNATWRTEVNEGYASGGGMELADGAIYVGHLNGGTLEVQDGGVVSNKVVVGGGGEYAHLGCGYGGVYLGDGGRLYITRNTPNGAGIHLASCIGISNFGYLEQSGGVLGGHGLTVGGYGIGVFHSYGGTSSFDDPVELGMCNNGQGVVYITNAVCNVESYMRMGYANKTYAQVTVDGPETILAAKGAIYAGNNSDYGVRINVNGGGTLSFSRPCLYSKGALNVAVQPEPFVLNVDGGTVSSHPHAMSRWLFGVDGTNRFSKIAVYGRGMTVDTGPAEIEQIAESPFVGATGGGVAAVDIGGEVRNLVGAPMVAISNVDGGSGHGATAVADWDPATRTLKGVVVTSRGWGYEQGKVKVTLSAGVQWSKTVSGDSVTVAENVCGGLTKRGSGTLVLNAANTWGGWTKVEGGILKCNADGAIPDGTAVTLSGGGTLDFGGCECKVESVTYGIGGGTVANAENVVMPTAALFELDVDDVLSGSYIPYAGDLDLSGVTVRIAGDLSKLDPSTRLRHALISVVGGIASGTPSVEADGLPPGWIVIFGESGVRLVRPFGTVVSVR